MHILRSLRSAAGAVPRALFRRKARKFLAATRDCRKAQGSALRRLIALNADSRFSREHGLDQVRSVLDLRRCLPVTDYEFFRQPIEQLKLGDQRALLGSQNPLLMFALSSGTTSDTKFIPVTRPFFEDYRRGWQIWGIQSLDDHPRMVGGSVIQFSSDYDRFRTPGGAPCGSISGLVAALQNPLVRTMYSIPGPVAKIRDPEAKNYTSLRLALADDDVSLVMTANPSTLIHLAKMADSVREHLVRDIADGSLSWEYDVPDEIRRQLRRRTSRRNPARARHLEGLIEATGRFYPRDYWPHLALVAVWTGGSAGAYLQLLREYYGDVPIRDHGLSASEGRMTIPLADGRSEGVLDVTSHFFEFVPAEESNFDPKHVPCLEAHELEEGREYFILLTTASGLYRYNISDVVRCTGFYRTTPVLEFLHKGAHIANVTGEKVSESQAVAAVRQSTELVPVRLRHFTVSPAWGEPPRYQILAEESDVPSEALGRALADEVDRRLQELNCEYREKRQTGRLAPLQWLPLPEGTWSRFARQRQRGLGGSLEQYKHPCLVPDLEFCQRLLREHAQADEEREGQRPRPAPHATGTGETASVRPRSKSHVSNG